MAHLFDQPSTNETITWKADSDLRGSVSIISTCTITLALGVWSAVHLNLPGNPHSRREAFLRRAGWIVCSLFAPEVLLLVAWSQLKAAKRVQKKIDEVFPLNSTYSDSNEAQVPTLKNKWTMTHSFWAIMGGIAVDVNGSEPFIPFDLAPKLTEQGIYFLLRTRPDLLPDIPEDEVKDKSKGDWLTKAIACIQATWFCVSCLVRVGQQLKLSLLELNTFAHAVCTIIVYLIWWQKPLDIERPLLLTGEQMRPLVAYMWMSSKTSARPKIPPSDNWSYSVSDAPEFEGISLGRIKPLTYPLPTEATVTVGIGLAGTRFYANPSSARWTVEEHYNSDDRDNPSSSYTITRTDKAEFNLTASDVRRWQLGYEAMTTYPLKKPTKDQNYLTTKPVPDMFNSPKDATGENLMAAYYRLSWEILGFSMLAAAYGAFHALAWNARFPSRREKILWRVSSLIIVSPAGAALIFIILIICGGVIASVAKRISAQWVRHTRHGKVTNPTTVEQQSRSAASKPKEGAVAIFREMLGTTTQGLLLQVLGQFLGGLAQLLSVAVIATLYIPARAYLVGESFRMAFHLPPDAFKATEWEKYFPHIG